MTSSATLSVSRWRAYLKIIVRPIKAANHHTKKRHVTKVKPGKTALANLDLLPLLLIGLDVNLARDFEVTQKNCRKTTDSYHHSLLLKKCLFLYTMDIIDSQTNLSETQTNVGNEHSWSSYSPNRVKLPLPSRWILCPGKTARKNNSDQYCTRSCLHQLKDMLNSPTIITTPSLNLHIHN